MPQILKFGESPLLSLATYAELFPVRKLVTCDRNDPLEMSYSCP
jgi:hypothetical protein